MDLKVLQKFAEVRVTFDDRPPRVFLFRDIREGSTEDGQIVSCDWSDPQRINFIFADGAQVTWALGQFYAT